MKIELLLHHSLVEDICIYDDLYETLIEQNKPLVDCICYDGINPDLTIAFMVKINQREFNRLRLTSQTLKLKYDDIEFREGIEIKILDKGN